MDDGTHVYTVTATGEDGHTYEVQWNGDVARLYRWSGVERTELTTVGADEALHRLLDWLAWPGDTR